jgi:hypothetical protein
MLDVGTNPRLMLGKALLGEDDFAGTIYQARTHAHGAHMAPHPSLVGRLLLLQCAVWPALQQPPLLAAAAFLRSAAGAASGAP